MLLQRPFSHDNQTHTYRSHCQLDKITTNVLPFYSVMIAVDEFQYKNSNVFNRNSEHIQLCMLGLETRLGWPWVAFYIDEIVYLLWSI